MKTFIRKTRWVILRSTNSYARVRQNSSSGFGGVAIKVKIKDGSRRPHLSTNRNLFREDTIRLLGDHFRQVSKKSDQWSRRRCDNEKKVYGRTDGRMDGGWYTKNQNLAAESYGIAGFKACKTNLPKTGSLFHLMKKHTRRLYCCFLSLLIFLLCMCAHSLIMVKIRVHISSGQKFLESPKILQNLHCPWFLRQISFKCKWS